MPTDNDPVITGVHHVCLTVTDIDTSMNWYQQLFQAGRWPGRLPHFAREETGFAEMLVDNNTGLLIGQGSGQSSFPCSCACLEARDSKEQVVVVSGVAEGGGDLVVA
jgi:hypothetical protein